MKSQIINIFLIAVWCLVSLNAFAQDIHERIAKNAGIDTIVSKPKGAKGDHDTHERIDKNADILERIYKNTGSTQAKGDHDIHERIVEFVTNTPIVERQTVSYITITKVVVTEKYTDITFVYRRTVENDGFYIPTTTKLRWADEEQVFVQSGDIKLEQLLRVEGYAATYTLRFPPLPRGVEYFDYLEPSYNDDTVPFNFYGITIKNPDNIKNVGWTEEAIKQRWNTIGIDLIEGIYEKYGQSGRFALLKDPIKTNGNYLVVYLYESSISYGRKFKIGDVTATLEPTATPSFFKTKWLMSNRSEKDGYIVFEQGIMSLLMDNSKDIFIKLYPTTTDNIGSAASGRSGSGTGWAISSNGYIVTNYHVTEGAKKISVRGVNGDFSKTYKAKVIADDSHNDLSIIKIEDAAFSTLGVLPYTISTKTSDVGTSVYVLGYPLRSTMGDEVKLTNGIISSKSGFQGDITSYQISVPIQPGNSGGPLLNNLGNVVGIVNAKHTEAENASYAIKASYLSNLIESLPSPPRRQTVNSLTGKTLSQQVDVVKRFVYIIEVE